jgi:hypothetical protein
MAFWPRSGRLILQKIEEGHVTGEISKEQIDELSKAIPLQAPTFYASAFRILGSGNDFLIIMDRATPLQGQEGSGFMVLQPAAMVAVSPGALKDLSIILADQIENHEKQFGEIVTPFTKSRES